MGFLGKVEKQIQEHRLIAENGAVLAAVSGGADSVALLYALHFFSRPLKFRLAAVHLNHGLRGAAAEADADFVRQLCWRLGVPCRMERAAVRQQAERNGISLEMAAREARLEVYRRAMRAEGAQAIATGHHADDQVEQFLLKAARGSGLRGLAGMPSLQRMGDLTLIRPLLDVTHAEAVAFLQRHGLRWREDVTNQENGPLRNRLRNRLIPELEEQLNPAFRASVLRTMRILQADEAWISGLAELYLKSVVSTSGGTIFGDRLERYPLAARRRMLMSWMVRCGVPEALMDFTLVERVEQLSRHRQGSRYIQVGAELRVVNQYGKLRVCAVPEDRPAGFSVTLEPGVETWLPGEGLLVSAQTGCGVLKDTASRPGEFPARASVRLDRADNAPIRVRSLRPGDRIAPFGMEGTRKLQDVLTDLKVPAEERAHLPVFECRGEIIWLPGYRISRHWKLDGPQDRALHLAVHRQPPVESVPENS